MATAPSPAGLSVGKALQDGWQVFRRNPWPLAFFALFALVLSTAVDLIPGLPRIPRLITSSLVDLWATVGLIRGAWLGLDGRSIRFGDLIRVNLPALWRLFSRQLVLAVPLSLVSSAVLLVAATAAGAVLPARGSSRARTRSSGARPASRRYAVYAGPGASPRAMKSGSRFRTRGERNETLAGAAREASEAHAHALGAHPIRRGWWRAVVRLDTHRERRVASRDVSSALTNVMERVGNEHCGIGHP